MKLLPYKQPLEAERGCNKRNDSNTGSKVNVQIYFESPLLIMNVWDFMFVGFYSFCCFFFIFNVFRIPTKLK